MKRIEKNAGQITLEQVMSGPEPEAPVVQKIPLTAEERAKNMIRAHSRIPDQNIQFGELTKASGNRRNEQPIPSVQSQEPDERPDPEDVHRYAEWLKRHPEEKY